MPVLDFVNYPVDLRRRTISELEMLAIEIRDVILQVTSQNGGHLASNLHIPTVTIADKSERMKLWRPGWLEGSVITLNNSIPSWKFFEKNWQYFISSARVLKAFDALLHSF